MAKKHIRDHHILRNMGSLKNFMPEIHPLMKPQNGRCQNMSQNVNTQVKTSKWVSSKAIRVLTHYEVRHFGIQANNSLFATDFVNHESNKIITNSLVIKEFQWQNVYCLKKDK